MQFNSNTEGLRHLTNRLKLLHKSSLPAAINSTLNNAAFDVKQNTMLRTSQDEFINRTKNFFKANSLVEKSTGFEISKMCAIVGFKSLGGTNYAVEDLEEQEHGGVINKKSFIPTVFARKGKSNKGLVKTNARLKSINKIIDVKNTNAKNKREAFVIAASIAGKGGFVLRGDVLFKIDTAPKSNFKSRKTDFKVTPLYSFKKGRKVKTNATHFMEKASSITTKKMDDFYIKNAEYQLNKDWK